MKVVTKLWRQNTLTVRRPKAHPRPEHVTLGDTARTEALVRERDEAIRKFRSLEGIEAEAAHYKAAFCDEAARRQLLEVRCSLSAGPNPPELLISSMNSSSLP